MNRRSAFIAAISLLFGFAAFSQDSQRFSQGRSVHFGGGGELSAGSLQLRGSIGQFEAGTITVSRYEIRGGIWPGVFPPSDDLLFRDGFDEAR